MCTCKRALELLSLRLDGALSGQELKELMEHLDSCEECRIAADQLETIHDLMYELLEEVPRDFHRNVMKKISGEKVLNFSVKKARMAWKSWAPMAAVFAVILLGAGTLSRLETKSGGPMLPPAATASAPMDPLEGGVADVPSAAPQAKGEANGVVGVEDAAKAQSWGSTVAPQAASLPEPQLTPLPEHNPRPRTVSAVLSPQEAGAAAAARECPGVTVADLSREDGSYGGWTAVLSDGTAVELRYLGVTPNEEYYEFSLYDQGGDQERNRFAVELDGGAVATLKELGQEAYDALSGVVN